MKQTYERGRLDMPDEDVLEGGHKRELAVEERVGLGGRDESKCLGGLVAKVGADHRALASGQVKAAAAGEGKEFVLQVLSPNLGRMHVASEDFSPFSAPSDLDLSQTAQNSSIDPLPTKQVSQPGSLQLARSF